MLHSFLPLTQVNLIDLVLLKDTHIVLKSIVQKIIDVFDRMEADHIGTLKANTLTTWLCLLEKSLIIVIVNGIDAITIVETVAKLSSVAAGPAPAIILIVSEIALIGDAALPRILHPKTIFTRPTHLSLVYDAVIEHDDAIAVN